MTDRPIKPLARDESMTSTYDDKMTYLAQFRDFEHFMRHTFGDDHGYTLHDQMRDIVNHGIDAGYSWFIYYNDIHPLYDTFHAEMWDIVNEYADALGESPLAVLDRDTGNIIDDSTFKTRIAWIAGTETANVILGSDEDDE